MIKFSKQIFKVSLLLSLLLCIMLCVLNLNCECEDLRENVFRIHILANSDSDADQALKLKVRDAVLKENSDLFLNCKSCTDAEVIAKENIGELVKTAQNAVYENGADYCVSGCVCKEFFNTRVYDDVTLPAGYYNSVQIKIGKAKGKNWWCILYPSICVPAAAKTNLKGYVNSSSSNLAKNGSKYIVRFKLAELYQQIKKIILKHK